MTEYKEMPLNTQIEAGDRVTMSGPSEGELTTRVVKEGGHVFVTNNTANTLDGLANFCGLALLKIERPVPKLRTVPGTYILHLPDGQRFVRWVSEGPSLAVNSG